MPTAAYAQYGEDRTPDRGGRILTTTLLPARRTADTEVGSRRSLFGDYRMVLLDVGLVLIALLDAWLRLRWVKADPVGLPEVPFHSEWLSWISAIVLVGRRRFPFLVALLTIPGFFTGFAQLASMIALYTVARRYINSWQTIVAGVLVWLSRFMAWPPSEFIERPPYGHFASAISGFLVAGLPIALALMAHARQELSNRIVELAESRERERVLHAHAIRADERAKLAREMHDVVSHQVSLIAMQAGALRMAVADAEHKQVAGTIRTLSTRTLDELRQLVSVLRTTDDSQPGLDELPELAADAGFEVSIQVKGPVEDLAAPVSGAVYRTVQEALTNIRKHATGASATVLIDADDTAGDVLVEVRNTPPSGDEGSSLPSGGHGLVGLRERAALLGGQFSAGPTEDGGFLVTASFPKQRTAS
ncbi:signal transduction histidine kinase [Lentzea atacamensis]|uniref:histidine kinase n=2 Tax=Lentzea TaxID=165301 RepID=A0A316HYZ9_9PSEU|nr:histidine kinase [Lentzea atacamensis]PWK86534.1 signal transduction histidine kinase [Lentzea atacamensis]RAS59913.1 signal transduction histidine kinase [Lentzea atacamensis]